MKEFSVLILATLISSPLLAQNLPDEINYAPYQTRFEALSRQADSAREKLQKTESDLDDARNFIREMRQHIQELEKSIQEASSTIADNRARLPGLERELDSLRSLESRLGQEIRSRENDLSRLNSNYESEVRRLRPMEDSYERKYRRLEELEKDVRELSSESKVLMAQIDRAEGEYRDMDRLIRAEEVKRRRLEAELNDAQGAIKGVEGKISHLESQQRPIESEIRNEKSKMQRLISEVSAARSELQRAKASGADAATISRLEGELRSIVAERSSVESNIRTLESRNNQLESQIRSEKSQLSKLQGDIRRLPSDIRESESRERSLISRKSALASSIPRMRVELSSLESKLRSRESDLRSLSSDLRRDEQDLLRQRQVVESLAALIKERSSALQALMNQSAENRSSISSLEQEVSERRREIPVLEQRIRSDRSEIAQGNQEIDEALEDETKLMRAAELERGEYNRISGLRNSAQSEMNQRRTLFNRYLNEAREIGDSQTAAAKVAGEEEGKRILTREAQLNGESLGGSLGQTEAKLWGLTRGEIQGYESGYAEGRASRDEISRAQSEGNQKGRAAAQNHVQAELKPGYFEESLLKEFKKDLGALSSLFASFRSVRSSLESSEALAVSRSVPPLTQAEISRSKQIATELDAAIESTNSSLANLKEQIRRMADPEVAFKAPTKIEPGRVNCSQVYKNVKTFIEACEASYRQSYERLYLASARESFTIGYESEYTNFLERKQIASRESNFERELLAASKIGFQAGENVGKAEIFQETYAVTFEGAYTEELPLAKERAKKEADSELLDLMNKKPLLTLATSSIAADEIKALDEIPVKLIVKNISQVPLISPVTVKITELRNASIVSGTSSINEARARSLTALPDLKIKVLASAQSGEELLIKGEVLLPGDLYQAQRKEEFVIRKLIAANPLAETQLRYDSTPTIKGIFKRYVHRFTVSIAPKMEDLPKGYTLRLTPNPESAPHMEMKTSEVKTGGMKKGQAVDADFSYVFKDSAKKKQIQLDLEVEYAGKTLSSERILLEPK